MFVDVHICWSLEEIDGGSIFISAIQRKRVATPGKLLYTKREKERERERKISMIWQNPNVFDRRE
jgi:ABC-type polar amino acid transport system ATPase subunit